MREPSRCERRQRERDSADTTQLQPIGRQFLHLQRHVHFHGHEPLDADTTPTEKGVTASETDAPLQSYTSPLHWDATLGYRVR